MVRGARRAGIDVGGTKCLAVVLDDDDEVVALERRTTIYDGAAVLATIEELLAALGPIDSVGVGVAGLVNRSGVLRAGPNLGTVRELEVGATLTERLGMAVAVDNDATCAAVAEWRLGAARGATDAVLVTFGTGIGGAVIAGGLLQRGANGFAGEPGHMVVDPAGPACVCGRRGCWERYASGAGLARWANEPDRAAALRIVLRHDGVDPLRGEDVVAAARAGAPTAFGIIDEFARWAALGLVNLTNLLDPEVLILGGGLAESADVWLGPVKRWFGQLLYAPEHRRHPDIVVAQLGERAGAIGAALLGGEASRARGADTGASA